jgi:hypothetical protein
MHPGALACKGIRGIQAFRSPHKGARRVPKPHQSSHAKRPRDRFIAAGIDLTNRHVVRQGESAFQCPHYSRVAIKANAAVGISRHGQKTAPLDRNGLRRGSERFCIRGLIRDQQVETAAKNLLSNNAELASFLGIQTAKTAAVTAGAAAQTAAQQTASSGGLISLIGNAIRAITAEAGQTGAGVAAYMAPIIGPAAPAAGAAAAASVTAMASFDTGSWSVPRDMTASIHAGELIVPSRGGIASEFRDFMSNGGFRGRDDGAEQRAKQERQRQSVCPFPHVRDRRRQRQVVLSRQSARNDEGRRPGGPPWCASRDQGAKMRIAK